MQMHSIAESSKEPWLHQSWNLFCFLELGIALPFPLSKKKNVSNLNFTQSLQHFYQIPITISQCPNMWLWVYSDFVEHRSNSLLRGGTQTARTMSDHGFSVLFPDQYFRQVEIHFPTSVKSILPQPFTPSLATEMSATPRCLTQITPLPLEAQSFTTMYLWTLGGLSLSFAISLLVSSRPFSAVFCYQGPRTTALSKCVVFLSSWSSLHLSVLLCKTQVLKGRSAEGWFLHPQGRVSMSGDSFGCHDRTGGAGILWMKAKCTANQLTLHKTPSHNQEFPIPNVNRARLRNAGPGEFLNLIFWVPNTFFTCKGSSPSSGCPLLWGLSIRNKSPEKKHWPHRGIPLTARQYQYH
jgi:hypothetical protein